jgi:hypothetical protein
LQKGLRGVWLLGSCPPPSGRQAQVGDFAAFAAWPGAARGSARGRGRQFNSEDGEGRHEAWERLERGTRGSSRRAAPRTCFRGASRRARAAAACASAAPRWRPPCPQAPGRCPRRECGCGERASIVCV